MEPITGIGPYPLWLMLLVGSIWIVYWLGSKARPNANSISDAKRHAREEAAVRERLRLHREFNKNQ